jgi:uncharacterized protein (DUF2336 family)
MTNPDGSLFDELDDVLRHGSADKRVDMLRRVTDLFLSDADRLNEQQIGVFDHVLGHLINKIEAKALAEISARLAPVENAPLDVTLRLARHEAIAVAGPVLTNSTRLTAHDLVEIARTSGQGHLLAISGRAHIEADVTDVLLDRGNSAVVHKVAAIRAPRSRKRDTRRFSRRRRPTRSLPKRPGFGSISRCGYCANC